MGRRWVWTEAKERAVELLGTRRYSQRVVAETVGVTRRTVEGWMRRAVLRERVEREREAYVERRRAERAARLAAWMAEEDARERAAEEELERRLAALDGLRPAQRARAMRGLMRWGS